MHESPKNFPLNLQKHACKPFLARVRFWKEQSMCLSFTSSPFIHLPSDSTHPKLNSLPLPSSTSNHTHALPSHIPLIHGLSDWPPDPLPSSGCKTVPSYSPPFTVAYSQPLNNLCKFSSRSLKVCRPGHAHFYFASHHFSQSFQNHVPASRCTWPH